jgi:hypothetical protein
LDTKWVHIVPMTRCFFQSCIQKNTHHIKGCDWLTSRKNYGSTSTKKLRLIIIGFNTPTNDDGNKDNDILAIASLASEARNAGKGGGGGSGNLHHHPPRALTIELLPPPLPAIVPRMSSTSLALLPPSPPIMPPKFVAQFFWTSLPSKTDVPWSTPQAISAAGTPAAQIAGQTAPCPSSSPLWPATIAVVIIPAAGVRERCHHPGKPVQAGREVSQADPAGAH